MQGAQGRHRSGNQLTAFDVNLHNSYSNFPTGYWVYIDESIRWYLYIAVHVMVWKSVYVRRMDLHGVDRYVSTVIHLITENTVMELNIAATDTLSTPEYLYLQCWLSYANVVKMNSLFLLHGFDYTIFSSIWDYYNTTRHEQNGDILQTTFPNVFSYLYLI